MDRYNLDQPLIELVSSSGKSYLTARSQIEGTAIFGGIGSGKTSGSGRLIALKYLLAGWGGLVLTVKPTDKQDWEQYCELTGRQNDLLVIEPGGKHSFNFLAYESSQAIGQDALIDNIVDVLKTVIRASQEQGGGRADEKFWQDSLDMLLFNVMDLCKLAYGRVTVTQMFDIAQTMPKTVEDIEADPETGKSKAFSRAFKIARKFVNAQIDNWGTTLSEKERERMANNDAYYEEAILDAIPDARLLHHIAQFFFDNFIPLSEKTRSIIELSFLSFLFRLMRNPIFSLFCKHPSTLTPEDSLKGKIILINLPVKEYHKVGRDIQILVKYLWQRAMERRKIAENGTPVFLWADEAQNFIHEKDAEFQATARSSRVATVYLSQNMNGYLAAMGGQQSEARVKAFLGTLATKIFHANADFDTNEYASKLIGDAYFVDESESVTVAQHYSQTRGRSLKLERVVRPEQCINLRTGGPKNDYRIEGYLHRQGDSIMNGQNHIKMTFNQNYQPQ